MKKLLILLCVLALAGMAFADVIIGTGTSTQYAPMSTYWNYYRNAAIYTAGELGAGSGTITALQWYCGTANTTTPIPVKIYLKTTANTTLAATTWATESAGAAIVFNASVTVNATGWFNFDITDTPYTAGTNVEVLIETGSTAYVSPYVGWRYTSTSPSYRFVNANADGTIPTSLATSYNRPNITFVGITSTVFPEPTNHVTSFAAGTLNSTSIQLNWTGSVGAQLPGNYLIQAIKAGGTYAAVADGTPVANDAVWTDNNAAINVAHVVGANTYTFTGLTANTAYEFRIWPYTNSLTAIDFKTDGTIPAVAASTLDPTIFFPPDYTQNFGTTGAAFPPTNWNKYSGVLATPTVLGAPGTGGWNQRNWRNITTDPINLAAVINIYGTSNGWLISPPISVPGNDYELKFDISLNDYYNSDPPETTGTDDVFAVLIGDGISWTPANVVRQWDNAGSAYVYNNISSLGETITIPLGAAGTKYIAFYGISTTSDADNDLFVDNVLLRQTPVTAIYSINPDLAEPWAFGNVPTGSTVQKQFTISNTGANTLTISSISTTDTYYSVEEIAPVDHSLTVGESTSFNVKFNPTVAGGPYTGTVTVTYATGGRPTDTIQFTGSAYNPATLPLTEGWESGQGNWTIANGTQTNAWYIGTADPYAGTYSAYVSNDAGVTNAFDNAVTSVVHLYKDIAFDAGMLNFPLTFKWKCQGESASFDYLQVFVVDVTTTPVAGTRLVTGQVGVNYNLQSAWQDATITLPGTLSGTVKRVVFSWWNDSSGGTNPPINFDDVSLTATPIPTGPPLAPTLTYPLALTDMPKAGFNVTWTPDPLSGPTDYYNVYFWTDEEGFGNGPQWSTTATSLNPTNPPLDPFGDPQTPIVFNYEDRYNWTVEAYSGAYDDEAAWPTESWFEIQDNPTISNFPWDEDFEDGVFPPAGWAVTDVDGVSPIWVASTAQNHTATPGTTSAFHSYGYADPEEEGWMVTPPLALPADDVMVLSFWSYNSFPTYYTYNGVWISTTSGAVPGDFVELWTPASVTAAWVKTEINLDDYAGQTVYLAFKYTGYDGHAWYVDDVYADIAPLTDIGPIAVNVPEVVNNGTTVTPVVTVQNFGLNDCLGFHLTFDFGSEHLEIDWSSATPLLYGETVDVTLPSFVPTPDTADEIVIETTLAGDEDATNDILYSLLASLPLGVQAYADCAYDPGAVLAGPVSFNLQTPGTITDLNAVTPWSGFLTAGDWMNSKWMGVDQTAFNFWDVNPLDGTAIDMGDVGTVLTGITQNTDTGVIYGTDGENLYTLSATGVPTLVGAMNTEWTDLGIVDIAYDSWQHKLLGACVSYNALFEINMATGAVAPVYGYLGPDINYTQGMAFDHENGNLYLAGYTNAGALYWIDPVYAMAWKVGDFQSGAELDGFAIPDVGLDIPVISIAADGTISWPAVAGATDYNIYSATDAYGTFTFETNTANLSWLDPAFPGAMKFYVVTANDSGSRTQRASIQGLQNLQRHARPLNLQNMPRNLKADSNRDAFSPRSK